MKIPPIAIFDVDGVLSTGQFLYGADGKAYKTFGPDDSLALKKLSAHTRVVIVSGDKRGWEISARRIADMGHALVYAPSEGRLAWIRETFGDVPFLYMGDSFTDIEPSNAAEMSFCPNDAFCLLRSTVSCVCDHDGGHRAVAEAVFEIYIHYGIPLKGDLI